MRVNTDACVRMLLKSDVLCVFEQHCTVALELSGGKHAKALYRRGVANTCLFRLEEAQKDLEDAEKANPSEEIKDAFKNLDKAR